jgi:hypothetical protein
MPEPKQRPRKRFADWIRQGQRNDSLALVSLGNSPHPPRQGLGKLLPVSYQIGRHP